MTREEIATMIAGIGLPYAYNHFDEADGAHPQGPPFICFLYPESNDFMADNVNYARVTELDIELYTDEVDFALEDAVEAAMIAQELPFARTQDYLDEERMFKTTYNTEVLLHPSPTPDPDPEPEPEPDPEPEPETEGVNDNGSE